MSVPDCFVVIRAAGERTEATCARLAVLEMGEDRVTVIHEIPFSEAVRRGFELGVAAGRRWTLCLDADVLLRPDAVAALVAAGDQDWATAPDLFEIEGRVADKLLGQIRSAGVHLYRTALLPEALAYAAFDPRQRRPESRVKKRMRERGYRTVDVDLVSGLHDHEQFHRDIFRKVFTHARKHERFMTYAPRFWNRLAADDADMRVAFLSYRLSAAINEHADLSSVPVNERVSIDLRGFADNIDAILVPAGLREKQPLEVDAIEAQDVESMLAAFQVAEEFERERPVAAASHAGRLRRAGSFVEGYGLVGALREYGAGLAFDLGRKLGTREI